MNTPLKGTKVKLAAQCFVVDEGDFESIADFWGIEEGVKGEVVGISPPPYQPHPIILWEKCKKESFQNVSWHPDNLMPAN